VSYKRQKVMAALEKRGYVVIREGSQHTIVGRQTGRREPVPRHREINRLTMRRIARNLEIPWKEFESEIQ